VLAPTPILLEDWFFHKQHFFFFFFPFLLVVVIFDGYVAFFLQPYLCCFASNDQAENTMSNDDCRMVPFDF